MAGVGEISAVIGLVQFGFSLATQLTTYIGDYQDAYDDITGLANQITATYRQVEELQSLIAQNAITSAFSDAALSEAEDCCVKAQKLAQRLWKLLGKSRATFPQGRRIEADDVDLSVFSRAQWPRFKPRVEQHKTELLILKQDILMVMVMYRLHPGQSAIDQQRANEQINKLLKGKDLALKSLREARQRRRRAKGRARDERRPHFADEQGQVRARSNTGESVSGDRQSSIRPERGPSYDDYRQDGDNVSVAGSMMEEAAALIYEGILGDIEQNKLLQEEKNAATKHAEAAAVAQYKDALLADLQRSHERVEKMTALLKETFGTAVTDEQITRFIEQQRADGVKEDQVVKLLEGLSTPQLNGVPPTESDEAQVGSPKVKRRGQRLLGLLSLRRERTEKPTPQKAQIFAVVISVDGDLRRASRIHLPTPWVDAIIAAQEKKRWWKSSSFKETMQTYARMDLTSRKLAEEWQDEEDFRQRDLVLIYARKLDNSTTRARKLLESSMLSSDPWDFYHGRVLLVYKVFSNNGNGGSPNGGNYDGPYGSKSPHRGPQGGGLGPGGDYHLGPLQPGSPVPRSRSPVGPSPGGKPPTFMKVNTRYLLPETLLQYGLPWEHDTSDPNYIIIRRDLDSRDTNQRTSYDDDYNPSAATGFHLSRSTGNESIPFANIYNDVYQGGSQRLNAPFTRGSQQPASFQLPAYPPPPPGYHAHDQPAHYQSPAPRPPSPDFYREEEWYQPPPPPAPFQPRTPGYDVNDPSAVPQDRTHPRSRSEPRLYDARYGSTSKTEEKGQRQLRREKEAEARRDSMRRQRQMPTKEEERQHSVELQLREEEAAMESYAHKREEQEFKRVIQEYKEKKEARRRGGGLTAEKIADMALASRSRSRSRSRAQVDRNPSDRAWGAEVGRERPPLPLVLGSADFPRPPLRRPTYKYPQIGTILENKVENVELADRYERREASSSFIGGDSARIIQVRASSTRQPPARGSTDSYSGRGILKPSDTSQWSSQGTNGGRTSAPRQAQAEDDSPSELYPSEDSGSDTDSDDTDDSAPGRTQSDRRRGSREGSLLGLDRTLTDSPQSISSGESANERRSTTGTASSGKGKTTRLRRVTGSISSIDPPYGEPEDTTTTEAKARQPLQTDEPQILRAESSSRARERNVTADQESTNDEENVDEHAVLTEQADQVDHSSLYE
ncbi:hypothetical protein LTR36_009057 [Oleoguttula mirabilis]|uniref:Fungal N-terminal domain-containing protein n=1 Tax=Oleoguttula mirabilis TaxID=1507867 RepID=A0AAV9J6V4_9PEZI|nr:hypothetical protein LTR36_009057 [Oleoguttula mirabilis]